jgi:hypothetical protein
MAPQTIRFWPFSGSAFISYQFRCAPGGEAIGVFDSTMSLPARAVASGAVVKVQQRKKAMAIRLIVCRTEANRIGLLTGLLSIWSIGKGATRSSV